MSLSKKQMVTLFKNLIRASHFDEMMYRRMIQGQLIGFYHPGEGAIAPGVGACSFLNDDDNLNPHHRAHGIPHMLSKGIDLKYYLAEHTGKETGCCQGRSSFHFSFPDQKVYMASGFIGFNFAPSVGWGWAAKRRGKRQIVMNCSGDGSYGQGRAHEAMLMAMNWKLPIIFFCENNQFSIYSTVGEMHPTDNISSLAQGYGMPANIVDGQDVFAVAETVIASIKQVRNGKGPMFIEAKCLRFREHDIGTPDLVGYQPRTDEEIKELKKRDPVKIATDRILGDQILTQEGIDKIHAEAAKEVEEAELFADQSTVAEPSEEELLANVYAS
jgi:TPP-dependent pyruvate/acetoin dehydrogenase alpha subunit